MSTSTPEGRKTDAGIGRLTERERHRLLAAERRRTTFEVLSERSAPIELDALVAAVAARENGTSPVDEETRKRVTISLHHKHLPLMVDLGVIDYNADTTRITSSVHGRD